MDRKIMDRFSLENKLYVCDHCGMVVQGDSAFLDVDKIEDTVGGICCRKPCYQPLDWYDIDYVHKVIFKD